jgi:hypothetical protein
MRKTAWGQDALNAIADNTYKACMSADTTICSFPIEREKRKCNRDKKY